MKDESYDDLVKINNALNEFKTNITDSSSLLISNNSLKKSIFRISSDIDNSKLNIKNDILLKDEFKKLIQLQKALISFIQDVSFNIQRILKQKPNDIYEITTYISQDLSNALKTYNTAIINRYINLSYLNNIFNNIIYDLDIIDNHICNLYIFNKHKYKFFSEFYKLQFKLSKIKIN